MLTTAATRTGRSSSVTLRKSSSAARVRSSACERSPPAKSRIGNFGPRRLLCERGREARERRIVQRFFSQHDSAGAALQLVSQPRHRRADLAGDGRARQQVARQGRIAADRREDQYAQIVSVQVMHHSLSNGSAVPTYVGTPVSTPWNLDNAAPARTATGPIISSRIVDSCMPVRFFTTEMALRTAP